jgi:hypothetical protein
MEENTSTDEGSVSPSMSPISSIPEGAIHREVNVNTPDDSTLDDFPEVRAYYTT